ncbi:MAG: thioredoxin family protein, partial [Flavobacteriia bacterium]|jgi:thiol:disulfide interchange protein|nr:thioredoxin family protein [Cryomorphaceae bacterium]
MKRIALIAAIGFTAMAFITSKSKNTTITSSEASGIKFSHMTLEAAKKEAAKTGKLIFIDAHTSWCGPCKKMAATSFMDAAVGELFNDNFVNLKIDCEKDADGAEISRLYKISAYPTLLFIDSKGKPVKQAIGFKTEDQLIALGNSVL